MARPSRLPEQRRELLPVLAKAFTELGYRRATTAALARACGVRENILYRHWPDKVGMFCAALDHVGTRALAVWQEAAAGDGARGVLRHEAEHLGEFGAYRILFAALSETDEPEIRRAVKRVYRSFYKLLSTEIEAVAEPEDAEMLTWAVIGLGTVATITQELGLLSRAARRQLILQVGAQLLGLRN